MKVNCSFGRFGVTFYCADCGFVLVEEADGKILVHPNRAGIFTKKGIPCSSIGMKFKNPFQEMTLEQTS
jgi:hypothetical protein